MRFVPEAISRMVAQQDFLARKHSPTILLGVGVASMVGSTVLACRATLKLEEVVAEVEADKAKAHEVKRMVDEGETPNGTTYTEVEMKKDLAIITTRGIVKVVKLYAPSVALGGIGILCLTKSHQILKNRNAALTAAYIAIDTAFNSYRERVVDRYGEEVDREMRYGSEEYTVIDEETGKTSDVTRVAPGKPSGYARWFDGESSPANWTAPPYERANWAFLRGQQNWANDQLRSRGHVFLNEVFSMLGMTHTKEGAVVGWVYRPNNENGDNFVDFGCFRDETPDDFNNGRDGAILLDFNVDGLIWDRIEDRRDGESE